MLLDAATRRNLEIDLNLQGSEDHTLFAVMSSTVTAMGTRHLRRWLHRPVNALDELARRQDAVAWLQGQVLEINRLHGSVPAGSSRSYAGPLPANKIFP